MNTNEVLRAVRTGQLLTVKHLHATGQLDRKMRDTYGATCLHLAARSGNLDLVKFLVENAGHSTIATAQNGALPSHDAVAAGHQHCLEYLLQWGCPDDASDYSGATILHLSARFGHLNLLHYLVEERCMDIRAKDRRGVSILHYAAAKGDLACLIYLIKNMSDMVNDGTESGATPAYFAVQNGNLSCLQHLVKAAGANVHLRANDGMQSIHAAAQTGQLHCVIWLVQEQGVLPMERDNDGATPLHFAASRGHSGVVRWLLGNGATCDKDLLGGSPLHDAAEHGQLECARILIDHGCDVNMEDKDFLVASDLAKKCGHFQVAKYLRSIEKRTGKIKGKGHRGHHFPTDHEAGVYIKNISPTNTSSSISSIMSDHESSSSMGTIEEELVDDRLGCYEVTESPDPEPEPQYIQLFQKLTGVDRPSGKIISTPKNTRVSLKNTQTGDVESNGTQKLTEVCSQGTQTDLMGKDTPPTISPMKKSLRRQIATEESVHSSPKKALLPQSQLDADMTSPTKLSPEKKELRFSSTVMVEEIARREDNQTSPTKRTVQMIPLNSSSDWVLHSPPPRKASNTDFIPSPPPLTNSPPSDLRTVTPRPHTIVIPPPSSALTSPTKLSPEKKELRFSSTVMVEEIARREDNQTSPTKRTVQMIPLNSSSDWVLHSPPPRKASNTDFIPSPPPLTNSPPPLTNSPPSDLRTVTPRPHTIVIPPPSSALTPLGSSFRPSKLSNGTDDDLGKPNEVSSRLSFITSAIPTPSPPLPLLPYLLSLMALPNVVQQIVYHPVFHPNYYPVFLRHCHPVIWLVLF